MVKSKSKSKSIICPMMVIFKGLQAAGDIAPFPYIKGITALGLTVLEIVNAASTNRKDIDKFSECIGNMITTLKNITDWYFRAGDGDLSDLQGVWEDFQWCLQNLCKIQKTNADKMKIMQYLMIMDIHDKISTFIQWADNLWIVYSLGDMGHAGLPGRAVTGLGIGHHSRTQDPSGRPGRPDILKVIRAWYL
ncbi:uncharacterized protein ARMOST_06615 [Armillaria ostoyae]|uniref:Uncharacterized protein n=1 Tax=Armillaria ostoyae TaxID=47428 RepID=A0A284R3H7_ARMOS|nr:uncharacterized protein ARMOST_06615 [Armillaria ostoyae]